MQKRFLQVEKKINEWFKNGIFRWIMMKKDARA